jgi:hypothetical protein
MDADEKQKLSVFLCVNLPSGDAHQLANAALKKLTDSKPTLAFVLVLPLGLVNQTLSDTADRIV